MSTRAIFPPACVSVVIPTYGRLQETRQCLAALAATSTPEVGEIIVVDNGSTDGTAQFLANEAKAGRLHAILNDENRGFAAACNQGAQAARGEHVFFLNSDTVVQAGWLDPLLRTLVLDATVAAAGPKLLYPDGTIQQAGAVLVRAEGPGGAVLQGHHRGVRKPVTWPEADRAQTFQVLTAAALLVRRSAFLAVDGFDEAYWNGNEDVDLCLKLGARGGKLVYRPESVIVHAESQSGPERWRRVADNVKLLTERWLDRALPDVVKHADGTVEPGQSGAMQFWVEPRLADVRDRRAGTASVVVLTYNALDYTQLCVEALLRHTDPRHELIFVDNASSDGTPAYLQELAQRESRCRTILNDTNLGFAAGNNVGLAAARGEHVVLLNSDAVVTSGWLERLLAVLDRDPQAGLVGPVTNNISGVQQLARVDYDQEGLDGLEAYAARLAGERAGQSEVTLRLVGFCLLVRRDLLRRIGGLDTVFGRGNFEDNDYCLRALLAGYRSVVAHDCFVHHFGSRSFIAARIDYRKQITRKWETFKQKWGVPVEVGYNQPCDPRPLLAQGFHPVLHFCNLPAREELAPLPPMAAECDLWLGDGERRYAASRLADAERIFSAVLARNPDHPRATNDLAVTLWQRGERQAAETLLEELLARHPDAEDAAWNLAEFRRQSGCGETSATAAAAHSGNLP